MARPGIMVYFDMMGPLKVLPDADKGRLFWAMLEYGKNGTVPGFDGLLALAWEFVKPKIDKDEAEYHLSVQRRQYATVCRERKRKGEPEITFDEWLKATGSQSNHMISHDNQRSSMMTNDNQWYPTTTTTTTTSAATAAAANTNEEAAATADSKVEVLGGELGKNVVFLSNDQMADLLDRMDLETFNYYVDKLSTFIIKNNAHVRNHYETILKWWKEDGVVRGPTE